MRGYSIGFSSHSPGAVLEEGPQGGLVGFTCVEVKGIHALSRQRAAQVIHPFLRQLGEAAADPLIGGVQLNQVAGLSILDGELAHVGQL